MFRKEVARVRENPNSHVFDRDARRIVFDDGCSRTAPEPRSLLESSEGIPVTAAIRDINARKKAEKHLAQMEGRYRELLEAAPDAMVVVDQGGEIVLLNLQAEKQFGYRRDELVGKQMNNIIPEGFAKRLHAYGFRSAADALGVQ